MYKISYAQRYQCDPAPVNFCIVLYVKTKTALTGNDLHMQITYPLKNVLQPPIAY